MFFSDMIAFKVLVIIRYLTHFPLFIVRANERHVTECVIHLLAKSLNVMDTPAHGGWDFDRPVEKMWTVRMFGLTDWWKHFTEALSQQSEDSVDMLFVNFALSLICSYVCICSVIILYCLINKMHFTELFFEIIAAWLFSLRPEWQFVK